MLAAVVAAGCDDDSDSDNGAQISTTTTVAATTSTTGGGGTTTTFACPTSTTTGGSSLECDVTFSVTNDVTLGALQFVADYASAPGGFDGTGDMVNCNDLSGSLASFNDSDAGRTLTAGLISLGGFDAPANVVRCAFTPSICGATLPVPADFVVTVVDATDPQLAPVTADMSVTVDCGFGPTTTISTSTTTVTTTTSTTFGGPLEGIGFTVDGTTARVGALQFDVDYTAAPGEFDGTGPDVECANRSGGLVSFNDVDSTRTLRAGFILINGVTAPRLLADCKFTASGGTPEPDDFVITIIDATDTSLNPIVPPPTIVVSVAGQ